jgi:hypothetical protein
MRTRRALSLPLLIACVACTTISGPWLAVENGTDLDVTLVVNGEELAVYPAGGGGAELEFGELPPLPWRVEARSPSGRVLTSMEVHPGDVWRTSGAGGAESFSSTMGRVDLSCGRLTIWAGYTPPSGPAPGGNAGKAGDCEP